MRNTKICQKCKYLLNRRKSFFRSKKSACYLCIKSGDSQWAMEEDYEQKNRPKDCPMMLEYVVINQDKEEIN